MQHQCASVRVHPHLGGIRGQRFHLLFATERRTSATKNAPRLGEFLSIPAAGPGSNRNSGESSTVCSLGTSVDLGVRLKEPRLTPGRSSKPYSYAVVSTLAAVVQGCAVAWSRVQINVGTGYPVEWEKDERCAVVVSKSSGSGRDDDLHWVATLPPHETLQIVDTGTMLWPKQLLASMTLNSRYDGTQAIRSRTRVTQSMMQRCQTRNHRAAKSLESLPLV